MKHYKCFLFAIIYCFMLCSSLFAKTGKEINAECRANLKALNEATKQMINKYKTVLTPWKDLDVVYKTTKLEEFLKDKPVPPTIDCNYHLVSKSDKNYQWCCDLHGVLNGNKTKTFKYHEYEITGRTHSDYDSIKEYSEHVKTMLQWTEYRQSPIEILKYNFNTNPITTVLFCIIVLAIGIFVVKKLY